MFLPISFWGQVFLFFFFPSLLPWGKKDVVSHLAYFTTDSQLSTLHWLLVLHKSLCQELWMNSWAFHSMVLSTARIGKTVFAASVWHECTVCHFEDSNGACSGFFFFPEMAVMLCGTFNKVIIVTTLLEFTLWRAHTDQWRRGDCQSVVLFTFQLFLDVLVLTPSKIGHFYFSHLTLWLTNTLEEKLKEKIFHSFFPHALSRCGYMKGSPCFSSCGFPGFRSWDILPQCP